MNVIEFRRAPRPAPHPGPERFIPPRPARTDRHQSAGSTVMGCPRRPDDEPTPPRAA